MLRLVPPCLALLALSLSGCGGGAGCSAQVKSVPQAAYAGSYTATYTPTGASAPSVTLSVVLDREGVATGTTAQSGATVPVTGSGTDIRYGCTSFDTGFELALTAGDGAARVLFASKRRNGRIVGTYSGSLRTAEGGTESTGTLVVAAS